MVYFFHRGKEFAGFAGLNIPITGPLSSRPPLVAAPLNSQAKIKNHGSVRTIGSDSLLRSRKPIYNLLVRFSPLLIQEQRSRQQASSCELPSSSGALIHLLAYLHVGWTSLPPCRPADPCSATARPAPRGVIHTFATNHANTSSSTAETYRCLLLESSHPDVSKPGNQRGSADRDRGGRMSFANEAQAR